MLVSIITPSFNQAKFVEKDDPVCAGGRITPRLNISSSTAPPRTAAREIIRKYEDRLAHFVSEPDLGQTDALNKGFALAKGEVLAWLNSDDTLEPHAVAEAVAYLQAHPEVGMVYGDGNFIDADDKVIGKFPSVADGLCPA